MGRWEPDAAGRLRVAALELFEAVGYEATTVAQIAERAGVTARTFFRHFADKPEVLFAGSELLERDMVAAVRGAPVEASALSAVRAGLDAAMVLLSERADFARRRHAVIKANPALAEREARKMAKISDGIAGALRERGVPEPRASLTAEIGVAVFRVAFATWAEDPAVSLNQSVVESLRVLHSL